MAADKDSKKSDWKQELEAVLADYPESHAIDGLPELHQRAVLKILGRPVDFAAFLFGTLACFVLPVVFCSFTPWPLAIPFGIFLGIKFGKSRNKEGDGIYVKKPKLRRKWDLAVPNLVRSGPVTPHEGRLIAIIDEQDHSWADLERRINERIR